MNLEISRNTSRLLLTALCLGMASGCTSWDLKKAEFWHMGDKPGTPDKIVAIWTDTILYKTGQTPGRGFGGRLMFYQGKDEKPIKVDGSIVVYAFDETDRAPNNARPDRKYVFTPDQIPAHYSKSKIGHSYSVWIPWDAVGGPQKDITLVVRFEPKGDASVVVGDPARQLLPGLTTNPVQDASKLPAQGVQGVQNATGGMPPAQVANQPVQQASYNAAPPLTAAPPAMTPDPPSRRMTTTTIAMPSGLAQTPLLAGGAASQAAPLKQMQPTEAFISSPQRLPATGSEPTTLTTPQTPSTSPSNFSSSCFRPRSHYSLPRSRVPAESSGQPANDRVPSGQHPGESPSAPGVPPGSGAGLGATSPSPAAASATY
jgi:hypothetical protein